MRIMVWKEKAHDMNGCNTTRWDGGDDPLDRTVPVRRDETRAPELVREMFEGVLFVENLVWRRDVIGMSIPVLGTSIDLLQVSGQRGKGKEHEEKG